MGLTSLKEWRARAAAHAARSAALKALLAPGLGLGPRDALSVTELACADPGCPDVETIVLVMREGEPSRALRIPRPLAEVEEADIAALCAEERRRAGSPP
ncbi:conserved hypothetical protein [Methylobacterium sp. 4-46]|uniref:hypothetical protein n=1 Tax=unclassified Methylobacterium TaxID=2615210 RepID=UPI000165C833|nr:MULTISPECIES: hypothetical protein [Methylobacterium]ACA16580.1 conserved hypothetical protein [Methylobacterium sp. 4-46]WFT82287.1 hypothetical protein QA634_10735 [Methylobacterium nodulans]